MATAMQNEATTGNNKSVAERGFREIISHKSEGWSERKDVTLEVYARVWHDEVIEKKFSNHHLTDSYFALSGRWALERLDEIPALQYSQTRRYLFVCVADAWLCTRDLEDVKLFAGILRESHSGEGKLVSSAIRSVLESRYPNRAVPILVPRLAEFFLNVEVPGEENEVFRTISKALGKYAKMEDLVLMAKVLHISQGHLSQPLRDFVQNAIKR